MFNLSSANTRNKKSPKFHCLVKSYLTRYRNAMVLDVSNLEAFADDKINVNEKFKFGLGMVENVGKGENAGYQHFLLFPQCFQKRSDSWLLKVGIVW